MIFQDIPSGASVFVDAMDQLMRSRVQVLSIAPRLVLRAAEVSRQTGLLSNDALVVAVMQAVM